MRNRWKSLLAVMGVALLAVCPKEGGLVKAAELPEQEGSWMQEEIPMQQNAEGADSEEQTDAQEDSLDQAEWELLPAQNLRWNELGQGIFDNPNNGTTGISAYVYGPSGEQESYWGVFKKGTITLDLYHLIDESGTYTFKIETLTYTDSVLSESSGVFEYTRPEIQLPKPVVKVTREGMVSAALPTGSDVPQYELGADYGFNYELYERSSEGKYKRVRQHGLNRGTYDMSPYMEAGKDYYVTVKTLSRNINKWVDSEWTEFIPVNPADNSWPFEDMPENSGNWKYENVKFVYERGIMTGVKDTEFQPDEPLTRTMFASVIYRMAGEPDVAYRDIFSDVPAGKWYSNAVIWAYDNGIVAGLGDGRYGIKDNITREQMARMLMEFARVQGYGTDERAELDRFADAAQVSGWAAEYMRWAVGSGMINGSTKDGKYYMNPKGQATRAECATMLTQFIKKHEQ